MSDHHTPLDERQIMLVTHLTSKVLQDPAYLNQTLKDLPGTLKGLGASEHDVKAIGDYVTHLSATVKDNNNVGFW